VLETENSAKKRSIIKKGKQATTIRFSIENISYFPEI